MKTIVHGMIFIAVLVVLVANEAHLAERSAIPG